MSTLNRRAMVERPGKDLSVRRQCTLLNLARSGVYRPKPVPAADDLALMRRIDELHLELPFYGSRPDIVRTQQGRPGGHPEAGAAADARDGDRSFGSAPRHEQSRAWTQDISLPAAGPGDHRAEPRMGFRHQCAAASGVRDEGRPLAISLQERVANHRMRRGSKVRVVSETEKASQSVRYGTGRRTHVNCRPSVESCQMAPKPESEVAPRSIWTRPAYGPDGVRHR